MILATDEKRPVTTDDDGTKVNILRVLRKKGQPEPEKKEEQTQQEETEEESKSNESFGRVIITYVGKSAFLSFVSSVQVLLKLSSNLQIRVLSLWNCSPTG